jgi:hypothetical protein
MSFSEFCDSGKDIKASIQRREFLEPFFKNID